MLSGPIGDMPRHAHTNRVSAHSATDPIRCHNRCVLATADTSWSWAPVPSVIIVLLCAVYLRRFIQARRSARTSRGVELWRLGSWLLGLTALAAALISPIDTLADQVFFIHMIQHVLLLDLVPIFLILGLSKVLLRPIARTVLELERGLGIIAHPAFAVLAYAGLMIVWHIPALYDAALEYDTVHVLEHVTFASIGALYWWHLLSPVRSNVMTGFSPVIYMVSTKFAVGFLGVAITFAREPLYAFYERGEQVWGLPPVDDQAVAGAIMGLEQSIVMGIALAFLFVRALSESERQSAREDAEADRLANEAAAR